MRSHTAGEYPPPHLASHTDMAFGRGVWTAMAVLMVASMRSASYSELLAIMDRLWAQAGCGRPSCVWKAGFGKKLRLTRSRRRRPQAGGRVGPGRT
jgi:hypothetical protein